MAHNVDIHQAQTDILRELLFEPHARYARLRERTGLESDHFKFHLKKLLELGYVHKLAAGTYALTPRGKEHANKLDTDTNTIERQPKVSVLIAGYRQREPGGEIEHLVQQRRKNPYYGYWGRIGGKIRWGETAAEAAARELHEETGLSATLTFAHLYHKIDFNKQTGELLEDKLFLVFVATQFSGTFVQDFEGGHNAWLTQPEIMQQDKVFAGLADSECYLNLAALSPLIEEKHSYLPEDY